MNIIPTLHTLKGKGEEMFNALKAGIRYSTSIVYYSVFVLVILAIGMLVLQKIDIIDDDREEVNWYGIKSREYFKKNQGKSDIR